MARSYIQLSRAWYGAANLRRDKTDEVSMRNGSGDEAQGVARVDFHLLGHETPSPTAKLISYDDEWAALAKWPDLISAVGELGEDPTPADVCAMLDRLGFVDETPEVRP